MPDKSGFKVCPFCKEEIRDAAVKCRYCGEWLEGGRDKVAAAPEVPLQQAVPSGGGEAAKGDAGDSGPPVIAGVAGADAAAKASARGGSAGEYWYGYLYVAFCGYLTYCAASHLLVGAMKLAPVGDVSKQTEYWVGLVLWAGATAFFAYVTYKLARREVTMGLIYTIVTLHGVNVLARGIYPGELVSPA